MVVEPGEKLFIVTRRLFEGDLRRHFVGEVKAATESTVRLEGYTFVFDAGIGKFVRGNVGVGFSALAIVVLLLLSSQKMRIWIGSHIGSLRKAGRYYRTARLLN